MYYFATARQTSTVKLPIFFFSFQIEYCLLNVNKSEITDKNAFNGDIFETDDNHESSKVRKTWF